MILCSLLNNVTEQLFYKLSSNRIDTAIVKEMGVQYAAVSLNSCWMVIWFHMLSWFIFVSFLESIVMKQETQVEIGPSFFN